MATQKKAVGKTTSLTKKYGDAETRKARAILRSRVCQLGYATLGKEYYNCSSKVRAERTWDIATQLMVTANGKEVTDEAIVTAVTEAWVSTPKKTKKASAPKAVTKKKTSAPKKASSKLVTITINGVTLKGTTKEISTFLTSLK